jgi:hypothetical protein
VLQRAFDWFSGLNLAQKVLALLFAALFLFSLSYLIASTVLYLGGAGSRAQSPTEQGAAANTASSGGSASASASSVPNNKLSISSARWEDNKAVVEGSWKGDASSVHCDLLEGSSSGKTVRWWDRSMGTEMNWSKQSFTQEFVAAGESEGGEPLDPKASYSVACSGQFSGGWQTSDGAHVEGTPPG